MQKRTANWPRLNMTNHMTRHRRSALYGADFMGAYFLLIFSTHISFQSCNRRSTIDIRRSPRQYFEVAVYEAERTSLQFLCINKEKCKFALSASPLFFCSCTVQSGPLRAMGFNLCGYSAPLPVFIFSYYFFYAGTSCLPPQVVASSHNCFCSIELVNWFQFSRLRENHDVQILSC